MHSMDVGPSFSQKCANEIYDSGAVSAFMGPARAPARTWTSSPSQKAGGPTDMLLPSARTPSQPDCLVGAGAKDKRDLRRSPSPTLTVAAVSDPSYVSLGSEGGRRGSVDVVGKRAGRGFVSCDGLV